MNTWNRNIAALFLLFYLPVAIGSTFFHNHGAVQVHNEFFHTVDAAESVFNHADDHCITCKILSSSYTQSNGHVGIYPHTIDSFFPTTRHVFISNGTHLFSNRAPPSLT